MWEELDLNTDEEIILVTQDDEGDESVESPSFSQGEEGDQPVIKVQQCECYACLSGDHCFADPDGDDGEECGE
jgi:hypothetical protein